MKLKIIITSIFVIILSLFPVYTFAQSDFVDTIMLDEIERIYPPNEVVAPSSYTISLHFDLNRYRLREAIDMEIKIYARKGIVSFTNSANPFKNYKFTVYDQNNKPVVSSDNYTLWDYRNRVSLPSTEDRVVTLQEGESYSYIVDLNNWFDFSETGSYKIDGSFNPMPDISRDFYIKADAAYFYVDSARDSSIYESVVSTNVLPPYATPSKEPPYDVVSNALFAMQNNMWSMYFKNMHMPSIIDISRRYHEIYREDYKGDALEDFTDIGVQQKAREADLTVFLRKQFSDTLSVPTMKSNFGNNFVNNLEEAFKVNTIRELSIRFELLYRTALPEDRRKIFDEFKKYIASAYDRKVRLKFIAELQKKSINEKDIKNREYYKIILDMINKEYDPAVNFTLLNFNISKVTIEDVYGLPTATVETLLYERFFNFDSGDIYDPIVKRTFILRKMGDYWYIVNYYDTIVG